MNYTYRSYPNLHQSAMMLEWLETSRQVYKRALRELKDWTGWRKCLVDRCSIEREYIIPADVPFRSQLSTRGQSGNGNCLCRRTSGEPNL